MLIGKHYVYYGQPFVLLYVYEMKEVVYLSLGLSNSVLVELKLAA